MKVNDVYNDREDLTEDPDVPAEGIIDLLDFCVDHYLDIDIESNKAEDELDEEELEVSRTHFG